MIEKLTDEERACLDGGVRAKALRIIDQQAEALARLTRALERIREVVAGPDER